MVIRFVVVVAFLAAGALAGLPASAQTAAPAATQTPAPVQSPDRTSSVFQDWTLNCVTERPAASDKPATGKDRTICEIVQTFNAKSTNQTVATVALGKVDGADYTFVAQLPIGVWLADGASLTLDKKSPIVGQYLRCTPALCIVQFDAKKDTLDAVRAGAETGLQFADSAHTKVRLVLSGKGFPDAFAALESRTK